jgi:hypothetical protein
MVADRTHENPYASPEAFGEAYAKAADAFGRPGDAESLIFAEGTITERDYLRAIKVHYRWGWLLARLLVLGMAAVYAWLVYALSRPLIGAVGWQAFLFSRSGMMLLGVIAAAAILWIRQDSRLRRNFRKSPLADEPFALRVTPELLEIRRGASYVLLRWTCFLTYRAYDDDLLILTSAYAANQLHVFPRRIFQPADWERFLELVAQRVRRA